MFWRGWGKKPRIIKDSRTPDVGGFAWLWSWGTFSYTIRWYLLFDWETRCVPVCWVYINFSRQEHSFSDKAQTQQFSLQNHMRHGLQGCTMDLRWFTSVGEICHIGNVDSLGLNLESSGLNSVILRSRVVQLVFPYVDLWPSSTMFCMIFMANVLKSQVCAACRGCLHLGTRVVIAMIRRNTRDPDFGSLESCINKTIGPTWATSTLLLSWVSAWLLCSPQ